MSELIKCLRPGRPRKERPWCQWCKKVRVNFLKSRTCSPACGVKLRWDEFYKDVNAEKKVADWSKAIIAAGKTAFAIRLKEEILRECKILGIAYTPAIGKLYIRSRNRGYKNGYTCCLVRWRKERSKRFQNT